VPAPRTIHDLPTPALLVDGPTFEHNRAVMTAARPGRQLRAHVKAFKSTSVARLLHDAGHRTFCAATVREVVGLASAGLGEDLLLANEVLDASRLGAVVRGGSRVTVAVDSAATVLAAAAGGVPEVLIDVNVGLPRCGCAPEDAGALADLARSHGLEVRGVMGYEGHLMDWTDRTRQAEEVEGSMARLLAAHGDVGGEIISAGGTGTFDINTWANEIQAGSFLFMDTHYAKVGLPFGEALSLLTTVISVNPAGGWAVVDGGLKALAMDHGNPSWDGGEVFFCSDEHTTVVPGPETPVRVGERVRLRPAHVDPTIAKHPILWVVDGEDVVASWPVDLRDW
jgi:D-serine deaminase-like pyridoxal phosphate-dependent protein